MSSARGTRPRPLRLRIESASRPLLARLHALPRLLIPLATIVLIAVGAFAPAAPALVAFALLFLFIAWIAYLSWPVVTVSGRVMRLFMLVLIVALALLRFGS
ncbi:MAG TPA: DUF6703 family protein [Propionibacteriaceae bacterium]|jgi:hypothetical protein